MDNVVEFPKKGLEVEVVFDTPDAIVKYEERIESLVEVMDLAVQGTYHVMDVSADEIMMSLLHMSAIWAYRADLTPEEFYEIRDNMLIEVKNGPQST